MKFPVAPQSMTMVVSTVFVLVGSFMGIHIVLLFRSAINT